MQARRSGLAGLALAVLASTCAPIAAQVAAPDQLWSQDSPGVFDAAEIGDAFGRLATGDFDGDGNDDLAIGSPFEDLGALEDAGVVHVFHGSAEQGLTLAGQDLWHQDIFGIPDAAEAGDLFGNALAAGDFDGDGYDDLAIAAESEDLPGAPGAGVVHVLYGSVFGLTSIGAQLWHQDSPNIQGAAETDDEFGAALAVGDFDNDGYDDLAIGVSHEAIGATAAAGAVNGLFGAAGGLSDVGNQLWHQDIAGVADVAEFGDGFGYALAAGRFNGDGFDDLAIGVRYEDIGASLDARAVNLLLGSAAGLTDANDQFWHQDAGVVQGVAEDSDFFGHALAAGDFDGDGIDDLAVGVPREDVDGFADAGAFHVLFGDTDGLTDVGNQLWTQNSAGIPDAVEANELFGQALAAADFDGDDFADLAVGVPWESIGAVDAAGTVYLLYGTAAGIGAAGNQYLHQDAAGVSDAAEDGDSFGFFLAAGDFDGDGWAALAVGVPYEGLGAIASAGVVQVFPDVLAFADGFETADTSRWSAAVP